MKENLQHYVYALVDSRDGVIFYIGKASGARPQVSELELAHHKTEPHKLKKMADIRQDGGEVELRILARDFSEPDEALAVESLLLREARQQGSVLGMPAGIVNARRGRHESRFRPWGEEGRVPGFDLKAIESPESARAIEPLYDRVFEKVRAFHEPLKSRGAYVRSQVRDNGFEFVLYPKGGQLVCFEYIARDKTTEQMHHADALRRELDLGGSYRLAKVDSPRPHLSVHDIDAVCHELEAFVRAVSQAEADLAD